MNNQSWVSRSVCSHLPISPAALCATTAPLHTELTQTYLQRSESYDHMCCYDIDPAQKVCCELEFLGIALLSEQEKILCFSPGLLWAEV